MYETRKGKADTAIPKRIRGMPVSTLLLSLALAVMVVVFLYQITSTPDDSTESEDGSDVVDVLDQALNKLHRAKSTIDKLTKKVEEEEARIAGLEGELKELRRTGRGQLSGLEAEVIHHDKAEGGDSQQDKVHHHHHHQSNQDDQEQQQHHHHHHHHHQSNQDDQEQQQHHHHHHHNQEGEDQEQQQHHHHHHHHHHHNQEGEDQEQQQHHHHHHHHDDKVMEEEDKGGIRPHHYLKEQEGGSGEAAKLRHGRRHHYEEGEEGKGKAMNDEAEAGAGDKSPSFAYTTVLSNEKYVDGALVLGESLKKQSALIQSGKCVLVVIVTAISEHSKDRLRFVGWDVQEREGLAVRVPKARWKDSFDKLYIFDLTKYEMVAFFDSDMLALSSPDHLMSKKLKGPSYVAAIGSHHGSHGEYFQSGMMVIKPDHATFGELMQLFNDKKYGGPNGRDGELLRDYFKGRFDVIDHKYSKHVAPWEDLSGIVMVHFRGWFKPWNNIHMDPPKVKDHGGKEFGPAYRIWWEYYEAMHMRETHHRPFGPKGEPVDPTTHVWMVRNTNLEYTTKLSKVELQESNLTRSKLVVAASDLGESCTARCAKITGGNYECDAAALEWSPFSSCSVLRKVFKCKRCEYHVYQYDSKLEKELPGKEAPSFVEDKSLCLRNFKHDDRLRTSCDTSHSDSKRLCPCIPSSARDDPPIRYIGEIHTEGEGANDFP